MGGQGSQDKRREAAGHYLRVRAETDNLLIHNMYIHTYIALKGFYVSFLQTN